MFERLMERAAKLGATRAASRRERLAARLRAAAAPGVAVSEEGERVMLSGPGLAARMALDPELRWLVVENRDER